MKVKTSTIAACILATVVGTATAIGPHAPKPKVQMTKVEDFKWTDPFADRKYKRFTPSCEMTKTFQAYEYQLHDLQLAFPKGLWAFETALKKVFAAREYPGSWGGWDEHQYDRTLLFMDYADMPLKVREWIEHQERTDGEGKGLFAVYNKPAEGNKVHDVVAPPPLEKAEALRPLDRKKVVLFAAGALYDILPLWVAEGSECAGQCPMRRRNDSVQDFQLTHYRRYAS